MHIVMDETLIKAQLTSGSTPESSPLRKSKRFVTGEERYGEAVRLYAETGKSLKEVAEICGVKVSSLVIHIKRYHKSLFFSHYNLSSDSSLLEKIRATIQEGQLPATHLKYKKAIEACTDIAYIEFNIGEISRMFKLSNMGLETQLKLHYPDILPERRIVRKILGIAARGPRQGISENYSRALEMYRDSDLTFNQVARRCNVSPGGFTRFMKCYHADIVEAKESLRLAGRKGKPHVNKKMNIPKHEPLALTS